MVYLQKGNIFTYGTAPKGGWGAAPRKHIGALGEEVIYRNGAPILKVVLFSK